MSDTLAQAILSRPPIRYGNAQARRDACRLLAGTSPMAGDEAGTRIAEIAARTGRWLDRARTVTVEVTDDGQEMPTAGVGAGGTVIPAGQAPDVPGALLQVNTRDVAWAAGLSVTPAAAPAAACPPALPGTALRTGETAGCPVPRTGKDAPRECVR